MAAPKCPTQLCNSIRNQKKGFVMKNMKLQSTASVKAGMPPSFS
jgi:hypothetical protein